MKPVRCVAERKIFHTNNHCRNGPLWLVQTSKQINNKTDVETNKTHTTDSLTTNTSSTNRKTSKHLCIALHCRSDTQLYNACLLRKNWFEARLRFDTLSKSNHWGIHLLLELGESFYYFCNTRRSEGKKCAFRESERFMEWNSKWERDTRHVMWCDRWIDREREGESC